MATKAQSAGVAGFQCRIEGQGATVSKQALPPQCGPTALLEASVVFPNCWDGKNLDSADHKSHMAYAKNYVCDAAHPVQLPQLTLAERFTPGTTTGTLTLAAMNSPLTLHADFLNAWKPAAMAELMKRCIYAHVFCEDVSDKRMPPGMTTTIPGGSTVASTPTASSPTTTSSPTGTAASAPAASTTTAPAPAPAPSSTSGAVIKPTQTSETRLTVAGTGFPMHVPSKIVATSGSATKSVVVEVGHDGTFTAALTIPESWAGTVTVTASADSGRVKARTTVQLH
jgi:hypothetical protein